MTSSLFPDVNVWLALTHDRHVHHPRAAQWLEGKEVPLFFCRFTQLGLLRLLTNGQVMGADVLTQRKAWQAYHRWFEDDRVGFHDEPDSARLEVAFEELSTRSQPSTKLWADAYLGAFARSAGLTLVSFDQALRRMPSVPIELLA
jgi:toxin-antitoxin system PIN domain toxin